MNIATGLLTGLCVTLSCGALAEPTTEPAGYRFTGDRTAVRICRAIAQDDTRQLQRALRDIRSNSVGGYRFSAISPQIAGSVTCNGMSLEAFSQTVGANYVASYLANGVDLSGRLAEQMAPLPEVADNDPMGTP